MTNPAGLLVNIYANPLGDATNHGVTEGKKRAVLVGPTMPELFEGDANTPPLELTIFDPFHDSDRAFIVAKPFGKPLGMFGGNLIYSSDSRFPSDTAIKVYDRYEP